jgi:hypothetical protein
MPDEEDNFIPKAGDIDDRRPVMARSFNFYYNFILPRRTLIDVADHQSYEKVEFGKQGGDLFPVFSSSPFDLRDFGLGVAMYFQTLQILCGTCFLCGLFQIQAINFYSSPKYSAGQPDVTGMLAGSAICTEQHYVCTNGACSRLLRICTHVCRQPHTHATNTQATVPRRASRTHATWARCKPSLI